MKRVTVNILNTCHSWEVEQSGQNVEINKKQECHINSEKQLTMVNKELYSINHLFLILKKQNAAVATTNTIEIAFIFKSTEKRSISTVTGTSPLCK